MGDTVIIDVVSIRPILDNANFPCKDFISNTSLISVMFIGQIIIDVTNIKNSYPQQVKVLLGPKNPKKQDQGNLDQRARLDYLVKSILLSNPSHVYVKIKCHN